MKEIPPDVRTSKAEETLRSTASATNTSTKEPTTTTTLKKPHPFIPALLIIDFQEDFCPPSGSLAIPHGRSILPTVLHLLSLPAFTTLIATKDHHPPTHISFATNHPNSQPFISFTTITNPSQNPSTEKPTTYLTRLWPPHCIQNTPGASLIPEFTSAISTLPPTQRDKIVIIEKGKDERVEMYSCFEDPFSVEVSDVEKILREKGVTDVYVVGLAGDYCVRASVIDAARKGFRVWVVEEGVRSVDEGEKGWGQAKKEMEGAGSVEIVGVEGVEVGWLKERSEIV